MSDTIELSDGNSIIEISAPSADRYAALKLIDWWDHAKLRRAKVMVVGAGALGNEVLKNLALLGVGYIFLVDFDTVEAANLSRSVLYRAEDSGKRKVEVAAARLREINPDVRVATFHGDVTQALGQGVYRRMDVVIGCLDNRAARLAVNRACWRYGLPWIDGALDVLMGIARVFVPGQGACYECTMTEADYDLVNVRYRCPLLRADELQEGRQPTTPTSASLVAAWQVQEAIKLLHGLPVPAGKGIYINGYTHSTSLLTYTERADCFSHAQPRAVVTELPLGAAELTVGDFYQAIQPTLMAEGAENIALLPEQEIISRFYCPACDASTPVYRPYDTVMPDGATCPTCGAPRLPSILSRLPLSADSPAVAVPLPQLGVPPLGIVQVAARVQGAERIFWFELSADVPTCFAAWSE
ncbi:MAG: thiamine biosynthesis protein ThiF [Candidatus Thermofonsia Clade 1 bacterium]|jgi:adenylyltransferase/sulfurtransferase|uniref:Thiamine biosynthesis protein ThiF n=1 Tax=Candidatus Thermofonsia Clade 1 bacterium TaxID=2364210 RepID=A0A2M8PGR6_9CHLR|nr:MAG: thiamine biosynthesis protein ThiF [Candidatus Thermofonsia Clade 1 bacterium]PJF43080.1 MAG: thiamine biosynthesis protein ThiF [Candidatus Thermofonsia Clade 1 bacterium]RMF49607.1 MAG: ThiF family adenylyltransferase [Chloroflexota bacterium]